MKMRTCHKCHAPAGTGVWVAGWPYCHICAEIKRKELEERRKRNAEDSATLNVADDSSNWPSLRN